MLITNYTAHGLCNYKDTSACNENITCSRQEIKRACKYHCKWQIVECYETNLIKKLMGSETELHTH